ncbi:hypothetical protein Goari_019068 [Gossypium aridum]|uniref:Uncharacterized protein n=1 Tax=Gossypium aridum TaxID=34290 RepID=A0A7J8WRI4_GOSAI|nr:hypothetical protein [Gossypium aridum]
MIASSSCPERSQFVAESSLYRAVFGHGSTLQERIDLVNDILAVDSDLNSLVKEYYGNFEKTFDLCTTLKDCLERARNNHGIIESAVKCYDEEDKLEDGTDENKSVTALEELRRFKAAEEPFVEVSDALKPVVTALARVLTVTIVPTWKRCDERWNRNEEKVKRQKKLTNAMEERI